MKIPKLRVVTYSQDGYEIYPYPDVLLLKVNPSPSPSLPREGVFFPDI
jgi:hypothetical protein